MAFHYNLFRLPQQRSMTSIQTSKWAQWTQGDLATALTTPTKPRHFRQAHLPVRWPWRRRLHGRPHEGIFDKSSIGREAAWLPDSVTNIQPEVESFNYQRLRKSEHNMPGSLHVLGAGLTEQHGTFWQARRIKSRFTIRFWLRRGRSPSFMDLLCPTNSIRPAGIYGGWNHAWSATTGLPDGNVGGSWTPGRMPHFQDAFTADPPASGLRTINDHIVITAPGLLSDDEIKAISRTHCDARTLQLQRTDFAKYTGFADEQGR